MAVLAICNDTTSNLGFIAERFEAHGLGPVPTVYREDPASWPDPADFDLVISTGSRWSVTEQEHAASLRRETELYRLARSGDVPIFGICYGAHALAMALGAPSRQAPRPEAGFVVVDSADPSLVPGGPWLTWHEDLLTVPVGATLLARTPVAPQAWSLRGMMAVQFHPELPPEELAGWLDRDSKWLREHNLDGDALLAAARDREQGLRTRAHALFDAFWTQTVRSSRS
jgi:GMP synthase-like glutamine amidotransferase